MKPTSPVKPLCLSGFSNVSPLHVGSYTGERPHPHDSVHDRVITMLSADNL
nr:MAG TPA: hypothetical protein [Caudoviricetes sp.]